MDLTKLFETQKVLRDRIGYWKPDKFERLILAMIVEFSECSNDWQMFKYWKKHNKPKLTLLEEYVDGFHFILEAGLDLVDMGLIKVLPEKASVEIEKEKTIIKQFKKVMWLALMLDIEAEHKNTLIIARYRIILENYLALGIMLGFAWEQIEQAYFEKNAINHKRQEEGY